MKGEFGAGPIDAICRAMESITGYRGIRLTDYQVRSVTGGKDAQGEVYVEIKHEGKGCRRLVSTDIVEASATALLNAINRIAAGQSERRVNQLAMWSDRFGKKTFERLDYKSAPSRNISTSVVVNFRSLEFRRILDD